MRTLQEGAGGFLLVSGSILMVYIKVIIRDKHTGDRDKLRSGVQGFGYKL